MCGLFDTLFVRRTFWGATISTRFFEEYQHWLTLAANEVWVDSKESRLANDVFYIFPSSWQTLILMVPLGTRMRGSKCALPLCSACITVVPTSVQPTFAPTSPQPLF